MDIKSSDVIWIITLIMVIWAAWNRPLDDTDNAATEERSGLGLYTDNFTGCQYLSSDFMGGITPRLDGSGRHVGCK